MPRPPASPLPPAAESVSAQPVATVARTGDVPRTATGGPGAPGRRYRIAASPFQEYVSAGGIAWYQNYARSLSRDIDDISRDFGEDFYDRMMQDPQVSSLVNAFRARVLEDGVTLHPAVGDAQDPRYEEAQALCAWCRDALHRCDRSLDAALWDLTDAFVTGNRVAELVWKVERDADGQLRYFLAALKPKPRSAVAFVVDTYYNLLGLLGLLPGMASTVIPGLLIADLGDIPNLLPRDKFLVLTFREHNSDPRGTSIARPAYRPWWLKTQAWPEYLKYLSQFATPSLIGFTPEDAEPETEDAEGNALGADEIVTPEQAMVNQLATLKNGTALAFPFGAVVQPVNPTGSGEAFAGFIDLCNREIAKAILNQTLATEEAQHQAKAASATHVDVLDTIVRQTKLAVEWTIRQDLLRLLVSYNFGEAKCGLLPRVRLGRSELRDFGALAAGVAALASSGYLAESQKEGTDELLGLPPRDRDADAQFAAQQAKAALEVERARIAIQPAPALPQAGPGANDKGSQPGSGSPPPRKPASSAPQKGAAA